MHSLETINRMNRRRSRPPQAGCAPQYSRQYTDPQPHRGQFNILSKGESQNLEEATVQWFFCLDNTCWNEYLNFFDAWTVKELSFMRIPPREIAGYRRLEGQELQDFKEKIPKPNKDALDLIAVVYYFNREKKEVNEEAKAEVNDRKKRPLLEF